MFARLRSLFTLATATCFGTASCSMGVFVAGPTAMSIFALTSESARAVLVIFDAELVGHGRVVWCSGTRISGGAAIKAGRGILLVSFRKTIIVLRSHKNMIAT